jgi:hypothetical protein
MVKWRPDAGTGIHRAPQGGGDVYKAKPFGPADHVADFRFRRLQARQIFT